jgi:hypothetical protein
MIKRVLFAALVFAAPVCLGSAQDAKVTVGMMGIGGMSCAHWRSTQEHLLEGTVWIYGFWTGLNYVAAANDQTQAKTDVAAIVAEVERTCGHRAGGRTAHRCDLGERGTATGGRLAADVATRHGWACPRAGKSGAQFASS